jgi:hypothetical protein
VAFECKRYDKRTEVKYSVDKEVRQLILLLGKGIKGRTVRGNAGKQES